MASATDLLRRDHRKIEDHLDRLLIAAKHPAADMVTTISEIVAELRKLTAPHFDREEEVLYPYLRALWPDLLAHMDEQHEYVREVEQNLNELLACIHPPTDRQNTEPVRFAIELHDAIQHHIVEEEDQLLRIADTRLSDREQQALATQMQSRCPPV